MVSSQFMDRGSDLHRPHEVHAKHLGSREDIHVPQTLYAMLGKGFGSSKEQGPVGPATGSVADSVRDVEPSTWL